ncbi:MAG: polyisoprenoid-binding protein [Bacteroidetes bacterium]|nr:MAG: polyisoprenoid-binding protein [Bacteroidota bacterium]
MKKVFLLTTIAALFMACGSPSASTEANEAQEVAEATETNVTYTVNATESTVIWKGTKPAGDAHTGTVAIAKGVISTEEGMVTAGNFVMNLADLKITDEGMDEETQGKLVGHLSTGDFFEVEKYPNASFEITSTTADSLTGNLTIKEVSKSITVPYFFQSEGETATATTSFSIDRTLWGITFNSGNFFQDLGDYMIDDAIQFDVTLKATK